MPAPCDLPHTVTGIIKSRSCKKRAKRPEPALQVWHSSCKRCFRHTKKRKAPVRGLFCYCCPFRAMLWRSIVAAIVAVGFRETLSDGMIRLRPHHHIVLPDPSVVIHVCQFREREVHDRHGPIVAVIRSPVKRCGAISVC